MFRLFNQPNDSTSALLRLLALSAILSGFLLAVSLGGAPQAQAESPSGKPVAKLSLIKAGRGLRGRGVRVRAVKPVLIRKKQAGFPISDVNVSSARSGTFVLRGGLIFKKGRRTVRVSGLLVKLSKRRVTVTGKIRRKRLTILKGKTSRAPTVDGGRIAISLTSRKMYATRKASKLIARSLRSKVARSRYAGRFSASAAAVPPPLDGVSTVTPEQASSCLPATTSVFDPARPGSAVDVGCAFMVWNVRDSWVNYLDVSTPISPASALPSIPTSQHVCPNAGGSGNRVYSFQVQFRSGWWDPASGQAALFSGGGVHFLAPEREIDIVVSDLELRVSGATTKLLATVVNSPNPGGKRVELLTMNSAAPIAGGPAVPGIALSRVRGNLTSQAITDVFQNIGYLPGDAFGCVDFGFNF